MSQPPRPSPTAAYRPRPHRLAVAAAVLTWPMLLLGGTVTVLRAGMAVPDWPTTFGMNMFLYNMFETTWAVFVEHGHRLYGSGLGFACLGLASWYTVDRLGRRALGAIAAVLAATGVAVGLSLSASQGRLMAFVLGLGAVAALSLALAAWSGLARRDAPLALAWLVLAAVVGQGALGGYRVLRNSTDLAFVHGCTAQAFFALTVVLCVVTGRRWSEPGPTRPDASRVRPLAVATALLIGAQVAAGAYVRHFLTGPGLIVHAALAAAVVGHVALLAVRVRRAAAPALTPSVRAMVALAALQVGLGAANWWTHPPFDGLARPAELTRAQALIRLGHQGLGALLLASSVVLALRALRDLAPVSRASRSLGPSTAPAPVGRELEAIA